MTDEFDPQNYDPRTDPTSKYNDFLKGELDYLAAKQDAEKLTAQRLWTPPPVPKNFDEQLTEKVPQLSCVYDGLLIEGGKGIVNAQWKAGKTTLLMNAARSLVTGKPFLNRFGVNVSDDERICYLNLELPSEIFKYDLNKMLMPRESRKRIEIYHAMDLGPLDFRNDRQVEWLIQWLIDCGVKHLFPDPLSELFKASEWGNGDPNDAFGRWWTVLSHIHREAKLRSTLIAAHTGLREEAAHRTRGISAGDKTDVNISYRYNTEADASHTDKPRDGNRFLSAFGRGGVNVSDYEVIFDRATNILSGTNSGFSRKDAQAETEAKKMWRFVYDHHKGTGETINKGGIFNALGWEMKGSSADRYGSYYWYCIRMNWVIAGDRTFEGIPHVPGVTPPGCVP